MVPRMREQSTMRHTWRFLLPVLAVLALRAGSSHAGCGCAKPPPPPAPIRPVFAPPDGTVTLFDPALVTGAAYTVTFGPTAAGVVAATAVSKRDYSDGVDKPQLVVTVPDVPPGPTTVTVRRDADRVLVIPADIFTVLQRPIALAETNLTTIAACYRAAVGADGTVYFPLDITSVGQRMSFSGAVRGYRLTFDPASFMIYNAQGVLMQLLGPAEASIFSIQDDAGVDGLLRAGQASALADTAETFALDFNPSGATELASLYTRPTSVTVSGKTNGGTGNPSSGSVMLQQSGTTPAGDFAALLRSLGSFEHDGAQVTLSVDTKLGGSHAQATAFLGLTASGGGDAFLTISAANAPMMTVSMNSALDGSMGSPVEVPQNVAVDTDWLRLRVTFQYVNGHITYAGEVVDIGPQGLTAETPVAALTGTLSNAIMEGNPILLGGFGGAPATSGGENTLLFDNFSESFVDAGAIPPPTGDPGLDGRDDGVNRHVRSFRLTYDRHEFQTYRAQHALDSNFFLDAADHAWHADGTRHIDHQHLIVAVHGLVDQQTPPMPGRTPPFDFHVTTNLVDEPATGSPPITVLEGQCDVTPACTGVPQTGCLTPGGHHGASLAMRAAGQGGDTLAWRWKARHDVAAGSLGDPRTRDGMALCVYDESQTPTLVAETAAPAGGSCTAGRRARPCWRSLGGRGKTRGFLYRNRSGAAGGIDKVLLRQGGHTGTRIAVAGTKLAMPSMPMPLPLRVQLQAQGGGCWEASFSPAGVRKNDARRFRATAD